MVTGVTEGGQTWVVLVEALALDALRESLRVELDLRAVLGSDGGPWDTLERAERLLEEGVAQARDRVLLVRALLILNRLEVAPERARAVAELVAGLHLLLLARMSGLACVEHFREAAGRGRQDSLSLARNVAGLVPLVVELERATGSLFDDPRATAGMTSA